MEEKRTRGRPAKPESERGMKKNIFLLPRHIEWLESQPEGMAPSIQRLIDREISKQKKSPSK